MQLLVALIVAAVVTYLVFEWLEDEDAPAVAPLAASDRGFALLADGQLTYREDGGRLTQAGIATSAAYLADGSLLYFAQQGDAGMLVRRDAGSGSESIVLRQAGLRLADLCLSPDASLVAATSHQPDGATRIVLFRPDGSDFRTLTAGGDIARAPAWIPGARSRLLFQSAAAASSPSALRMLNLENGKALTVLAEGEFDLLKPRVDPAGNLLFIRRLHQGRHGLEGLMLDLLSACARLLRLAPAEGTRVLLQGQSVACANALPNAYPLHGVPALVPCSWHLVRRDTEGNELVLATNVASYDVGADGTVMYSNGRGVFVLEPNGASRLAHTQQLVAEVIAA